jgi:MoaA/NifB/PqqE/SkfB family radical SAM enzyme
VEQARADIDETCGRPGTIGVEFGGACSLACRLHRRAHKCQPGGLDLRDLLDRLAYATKVGATALYLLGGEPAEHPGYLAFLRAARAANFRRVTCETTALPFASDGFAEAARRAGLDEVVVEVLAFDEPTFDAVSSTHGQFRRFLGGLDALERAGIAWRAKVLVDAASIAALPRTLSSLRHRRLPVLEVVTPGEEGLPGRVRSLLDAAGFADAVLRCL